MDLSTRQGRHEQGQRIQRAVERAGLSIEELAGRIGCSRALIYQYLSGSTLAQPDRLQQIATQCGVPLIYFYTDALDDLSVTPPASTPSVSSVPPGSAANPDAEGERTAASLPVSPSTQDVTARLNDGLRTLQELAGAQESPPDYRALASTCERILSLAAQMGDRDAQVRAQLDLGIALNKIGDFPRAVDALNHAVALAVETGNTQSEMAARQSLGRALTMMGRTEQARAQFQRIAEGGDFNARWRGLLSLGSLHEQRGEYQQAMQRFDEAAILLEEGDVNRLAEPNLIKVGLLYVNTNRRNVYLAGGDLKEAHRLAERCLTEAEALGNAEQNLEARLDMGWCDLYTGQWTQAYTGLTAMLQLARFVGDQQRETMARIGLGVFFAAAGDFDSAISNGKDALSVALSRGDRLAELYAQLALADAYAGPEGRGLEARYHANQALAVTTSVNYARSEVECRLRLARVYAQTGDTEGLRDAATRALALARNLGARHLESLAHAWLAEANVRIVSEAQEGEIGQTQGVRKTGNDIHNAEATSTVNRADEDSELLRRAAEEVGEALTLADTTGYIETHWRAHSTRALIAQLSGDQDQAEQSLREAVATLEILREHLVSAGIPDTLLENEDCQRVYARLALLLLQSGRQQDAATLLEQTGWPPLNSRLAATVPLLLSTSGE